ncbi:MAG: hypothetical protein Q7W30_04605 [Coriobacteriia bacterium]|nr:hypothetical protein [Coriobacteriia bacterium]
MRVAVVQHRMRAHERMDLASLLTLCERASEEGAQVIVLPAVPGLAGNELLIQAFLRNAEERAPGLTWITPQHVWGGVGEPVCRPTALGSTLVLGQDHCIDPDVIAGAQELSCDTMVWQFDAEDALQAEALLEFALDASVAVTPLIVIADVVGSARGVEGHGTSAIVYMGEIMAEAGSGEDLLIADVPAPAPLTQPSRRVPSPAPVLAQRLAAHHGTKLATPYPADLT